MPEITEADRKKAEELVKHFNDRRLIPKRGYSLCGEDKAYLTQFVIESLAEAREEGRDNTIEELLTLSGAVSIGELVAVYKQKNQENYDNGFAKGLEAGRQEMEEKV